MRTQLALSICVLATLASSCRAAGDLNLVPYPREVRPGTGGYRLIANLSGSYTGTPVLQTAVADLVAEVGRLGGRLDLRAAPGVAGDGLPRVTIGRSPATALVPPTQAEGYVLEVAPQGVALVGRDERGALWGLQALRQLVRANRAGRSIPCVTLRDWPALRYRGTQDDITRGPSPTLQQLQYEVGLASYLRLNTFTYYLEHQFAFSKHPLFGPPDGSVKPDELRTLDSWAGDRGVEIIGNQQSFGHFGNMLQHPQYAQLAETPDVLSPVREGTYRLLADMYGDQAPLLRSRLFNVCCDETYGLGTGPSKPLADRIGVGRVYLGHVQRIHDILRDQYGKRMMMWGDIILQHPELIPEIPADTVMLSWGYHAAETFEPAITPFKKAGFEFWVCPGVNNWSRIVPDFGTTVANVRTYLRDGIKLGATGMLNTVWNDDGETLFGPNWHGVAWGAECAWGGCSTSVEDFNRRLGAVLFGERGGHFGKAIGYLTRAQSARGYEGLFNSRLHDFQVPEVFGDPVGAANSARALLALADPAIKELEAARREASANTVILDHYLLGARRVAYMGRRVLVLMQAAQAYENASARLGRRPRRSIATNIGVSGPSDWRTQPKPFSPEPTPAPTSAMEMARSRDLVRALRSDLMDLWFEFARLWRLGNRPYSLDRVRARYDADAKRLDELASRIDAAYRVVETGQVPPSAIEVGLAAQPAGGLPAATVTRDASAGTVPLEWAVAGAARRLAVTLAAPGGTMVDRLVAADLAQLGLSGTHFAVRRLEANGSQAPVVCQVVPDTGRSLLVWRAAPGTGEQHYVIYCGAADTPAPQIAVSARKDGSVVVDNGAGRLTIGREGAHIYKWEVAALGGRDVTHPGEKEWAGFGDINGAARTATNRLKVSVRGPLMVRVVATDPSGLQRTLDLWAGCPWVEMRLSRPTAYLACFDDISLIGAAGAHPGTYLFDNGDTGPLKPLSGTPDCQEHRSGRKWCAKYATGSALMALMTPGRPAAHCVGPGDGMGGVDIEGGDPVSRFVMVAQACPDDPAAHLASLLRAREETPALTVRALEVKAR